MKHITIYSTPTCHYCNDAKAFFKEKGLKYTEYNVLEDAEKRKEMIERSQGTSVPVITVGDRLFVGYSALTDAIDKGFPLV